MIDFFPLLYAGVASNWNKCNTVLQLGLPACSPPDSFALLHSSGNLMETQNFVYSIFLKTPYVLLHLVCKVGRRAEWGVRNFFEEVGRFRIYTIYVPLCGCIRLCATVHEVVTDWSSLWGYHGLRNTLAGFRSEGLVSISESGCESCVSWMFLYYIPNVWNAVSYIPLFTFSLKHVYNLLRLCSNTNGKYSHACAVFSFALNFR